MECLHQPMGTEKAPLGTVWVNDLEENLKKYHKDMAVKELLDSTDSEVQTNLALFGLNVAMKDGEFKSVYETNKTYSSGGKMLLHSSADEFVDIGQKRKKLKEDIKSREDKLAKKITSIGAIPCGGGVYKPPKPDSYLEKYDRESLNVQKIRQEIKEYTAKLQNLEEDERLYSPPIFSENLFSEHTNALYDPEQTITRIVDLYVQKSQVDETQITMNEQIFEKNQIDYFVLNLHSRTDMCPFCCMFLADHLQKWKRKFEIPFLAIVSSRQEYRCNFSFMKNKPYFKGFSMRSFGWCSLDVGKSIEGIKQIAEQGLVVQYAFQPHDIYT